MPSRESAALGRVEWLNWGESRNPLSSCSGRVFWFSVRMKHRSSRVETLGEASYGPPPT